MGRVHAVMTGLLRDPLDLIETASRLFAWREEGLLDGIILSTWKSEIDPAPALRQAMREVGITMLTPQQPEVPGPGHVFFQAKSVLGGIEGLETDDIVLRCRTDKTLQIIDGFLPYLRDLKAGRDLPVPWVAHFPTISRPFHFNDMVSLSRKSDLLRLLNMDFRLHEYYGQLTPEARYWITPFLAQPELQPFFETVDQGRLWLLMHVLATFDLGPDFLPPFIAAFWRRYFGIMNRELAFCALSGEQPAPVEGLRANDLFAITPTGETNVVHTAGWAGVQFRSLRLLRAAEALDFRPSAFGEALRQEAPPRQGLAEMRAACCAAAERIAAHLGTLPAAELEPLHRYGLVPGAGDWAQRLNVARGTNLNPAAESGHSAKEATARVQNAFAPRMTFTHGLPTKVANELIEQLRRHIAAGTLVGRAYYRGCEWLWSRYGWAFSHSCGELLRLAVTAKCTEALGVLLRVHHVEKKIVFDEELRLRTLQLAEGRADPWSLLWSGVCLFSEGKADQGRTLVARAEMLGQPLARLALQVLDPVSRGNADAGKLLRQEVAKIASDDRPVRQVMMLIMYLGKKAGLQRKDFSVVTDKVMRLHLEHMM